MRKLLAALVLAAFAFVVQMPFVHALDMNMDHDMMGMSSIQTSSHISALCSSDTKSSSESCYNEIPESKWIQSVEEIGITAFMFAVLAVFLNLLDLRALGAYLECFFKRRVFYNPTLYLGLYGIVRNVN